MKRTLTSPVIRDETLARIVKGIYAELTALWEMIPEAQRVDAKEAEGKPGEIRITVRDGVTYLQARGPEGWVEVPGTKVTR